MALGVGSAKQMGLLSYRILVRGVRVELRSLQVTLSKNRTADLPWVPSLQPQPLPPPHKHIDTHSGLAQAVDLGREGLGR